jgi:hypothetical protein
MYRIERNYRMNTPAPEKITYYGLRSDWQTIKDFFGTFSNGVRILANLIRTNPEAIRKLTDSPKVQS